MKAITAKHVSLLVDKLSEQQDVSRELLDALKIARCAFLGHNEDGSYRGDGIKFSAGERTLIESAIAKAEAL